MASVEQVLETAFDDVKSVVQNDVVNGIKNHPQYAQIIDALVAKGVQALITAAGA